MQGAQAERLEAALFQGGTLNRHMIARDIDRIIEEAGVAPRDAEGARFLMIEGKRDRTLRIPSRARNSRAC